MFRVAGLTETAIWRLGSSRVGEPRGRTVRARAQFNAASALRIGLRFRADDRPPRHADLVGWPQGKDEQLQVAQLLAVECRLFVCPDS